MSLRCVRAFSKGRGQLRLGSFQFIWHSRRSCYQWMLHPRLTCCAASGVFRCVMFVSVWSIMSEMISDHTVFVRYWPQVSIHSRKQEIWGWYKTFIFPPSTTLVDRACFVRITFTHLTCVCVCARANSCLVLISKRMMAYALLTHMFLISCCRQGGKSQTQNLLQVAVVSVCSLKLCCVLLTADPEAQGATVHPNANTPH